MVARFFIFIIFLSVASYAVYWLSSWLFRQWAGQLQIWKANKELETDKKLEKYKQENGN